MDTLRGARHHQPKQKTSLIAALTAYLRLLLDRIADHNISRIGELTPWNLRPDAA